MPLVKTGVVTQSIMGKKKCFLLVIFFQVNYLSALGATGFVGWLCYKAMEGSDEDMYRNSHLRTRDLENKKDYDPNKLLIETIKRGGAADLG